MESMIRMCVAAHWRCQSTAMSKELREALEAFALLVFVGMTWYCAAQLPSPGG